MAVETRLGPLRQMQEDFDNIIRRLNNLEGEVRQRGTFVPPANPYTPGPYNPGYPNTGTPQPAPGAWWGINPNGPWTTSKSTSASSYTLTGDDKDSLG